MAHQTRCRHLSFDFGLVLASRGLELPHHSLLLSPLPERHSSEWVFIRLICSRLGDDIIRGSINQSERLEGECQVAGILVRGAIISSLLRGRREEKRREERRWEDAVTVDRNTHGKKGTSPRSSSEEESSRALLFGFVLLLWSLGAAALSEAFSSWPPTSETLCLARSCCCALSSLGVKRPPKFSSSCAMRNQSGSGSRQGSGWGDGEREMATQWIC